MKETGRRNNLLAAVACEHCGRRTTPPAAVQSSADENGSGHQLSLERERQTSENLRNVPAECRADVPVRRPSVLEANRSLIGPSPGHVASPGDQWQKNEPIFGKFETMQPVAGVDRMVYGQLVADWSVAWSRDLQPANRKRVASFRKLRGPWSFKVTWSIS